jgi:EAL domain-containing protein (putative c-di-GMP-specific phosphodiesterase class I)
VELCGTLGIRVAAEYDQDERTRQLLTSYGVDFAQGYHIGRPTPIVGSAVPKGPTIELELRRPSKRRTASG